MIVIPLFYLFFIYLFIVFYFFFLTLVLHSQGVRQFYLLFYFHA